MNVHYDHNLPVELHTDASYYAVGGALLHVYESEVDGKMIKVARPYQFTSRTIKSHELKWTTPEKECLALMYCLSVFRKYLAMRHFARRTDSISLTYLKNLKNPYKSRIGQW